MRLSEKKSAGNSKVKSLSPDSFFEFEIQSMDLWNSKEDSGGTFLTSEVNLQQHGAKGCVLY